MRRIGCFLIALLILWPSPAAPDDFPSPYVNTARFDLDAFEREALSAVNHARQARGLTPYEPSARLWNKAKHQTRRMALDQRLEQPDLRDMAGGPASSDPMAFWGELGGLAARVVRPSALPALITRWLDDAQSRALLLKPHYNRSAVAVSVDRAGFLYVALIAGEEIYTERDLRRLERQVFEAVNARRGRHGRPALVLLPPLTRVARSHSEHMALRHFASHTDVTGRDVVARLRDIGFTRWQICAENIASNHGLRDPVQAALEGWMNSPAHAAALLRREFTHTGIGVARSLDDTYYFTQVFIKASQSSP